MWRRGSSINNAQEAGSLLKGNGEAVDLGERRGRWGGGLGGVKGGEAEAGMYCMRQVQTKRKKKNKQKEKKHVLVLVEELGLIPSTYTPAHNHI